MQNILTLKTLPFDLPGRDPKGEIAPTSMFVLGKDLFDYLDTLENMLKRLPLKTSDQE